MPSASEFSANPDLNTMINGLFVGENCSPEVLNNVLRYLAAVARTSYDQIQTAGGGMPISGGAFTGEIIRQGRGGYLHHAVSGRGGTVSFLPEGSARPAAAEGAIVFYYS